MLDDADASWRSPKVLLVLAIVFLCGITCGSAATRFFLHSRSHVPTFSELKVKLGLTPDQEKTVMKELDDYAKYYQNIEEERADVAEHGRQRIYYVLTPEQRKRFDQLFPVLPTGSSKAN
jgi:hypothetical protein